MSTGRKPVDRVAELEAMRDRLIVASKEAEPRELPALSRELRQVMAELESMEDIGGSGIADELDKQRVKRVARSEASGS